MQVLYDYYRIGYYTRFLNSACSAIREHNLNVPMMFAWTWMDNFEWASGYDKRFGMVHVDFKRKTLQRRIKASGYWWSRHFFSVSTPQGNVMS